ncbi:MAG: cysteine peptidase family C39 domain-containing protein, partial [Arenibacter sp.]
MTKLLSFPHIKQSDVMECGTTCLAIIFKYYGYYDVRNFLNQYAEIDSSGIDLYTMSEIAEGFGFSSDGYQMDFQNFNDIPLPCIIHYE